MASEKQYENKIKKFLISEGVYEAGTPEHKIVNDVYGWFFKTWGGGMQRSGIPDLIINCNGYFLGIELKAPNGKPTELQKKNIDLINRGNGVGWILYPKDFELFKELIYELKGGVKCGR